MQLPADSAAANLLGLPNLKPENSTSYSVGVVAHPLEDLSVTVDAYSIVIGNRISTSSTITSSGGAINTPLVTSAIALFGVTLDPTATQQGVTAFLNGYATHTSGVDITTNYPTDFGDKGLVNWTLAANYNHTQISRVAPPPAVITASNPNATFFTFGGNFNFAHPLPDWRVGITADWSLDEWGATLRETFYGPNQGYSTPNAGGEFIPQNQASVGLTDLEGRYNVTDQLQLSIGANNLFSIKPNTGTAAPNCAALPADVVIATGGSCKQGPNQTNGEVQTAGNGQVYQPPLGTAFDPNGGYYYARITFNF